MRNSFRTVQQLGGRVFLTGSWGDQVLFHQAYLVDLFRSLAWREVRTHLNEFGLWQTDADPAYFRRRFVLDLVKYHLPRPFFPMIRRLRMKRARPWYSGRLRRRASRRAWNPPIADGWKSPSSQARSIYEEARSAYHVLGMELNNKLASIYGLESAYPFLDRDLVAFLMAIPGEVLTRNGVPKALLRAALSDVLPEAIALRRSKGDYTHLVNEAVERDFSRIVHCLESEGEAVKRGYVSRDVLEESLGHLGGQIQGPTCEVAWRLSDLTGLELWLRLFFGEGRNGKEILADRGSGPKLDMISGGRR